MPPAKTNEEANKALVPTAGASLSPRLSVTRTRLPVSTPHPAPAVGTAYSFAYFNKSVANAMKKGIILFATTTIVLAALIPGWVISTRNSARLNLSNMDDLLLAEKCIGLVPVSKEIHADGVGFVDQTIFYDATVTPNEVVWLDPKFEQSSFQAPGGSPLWWRFGIWWDALDGDMKYYSSDSRTSARFAYSQRKKIVYGYFDLP